MSVAHRIAAHLHSHGSSTGWVLSPCIKLGGLLRCAACCCLQSLLSMLHGCCLRAFQYDRYLNRRCFRPLLQQASFRCLQCLLCKSLACVVKSGRCDAKQQNWGCGMQFYCCISHSHQNLQKMQPSLQLLSPSRLNCLHSPELPAACAVEHCLGMTLPHELAMCRLQFEQSAILSQSEQSAMQITT